eukprot:snap_masked-scaffold_14-processed-gene-8.7-mRNA-1 protein AED:1.00 eAED:1.00 QI:0/-1/0/0/-1/1/1/0/91
MLNKFKSADKYQRKRLAKKIINGFIVETSLATINISGPMRKAAIERYETGDLSIDMFEDVEHEVLELLRTNSLRKFQSSPLYSLAVHHYRA